MMIDCDAVLFKSKKINGVTQIVVGEDKETDDFVLVKSKDFVKFAEQVDRMLRQMKIEHKLGVINNGQN
jgi:hypothetical protein